MEVLGKIRLYSSSFYYCGVFRRTHNGNGPTVSAGDSSCHLHRAEKPFMPALSGRMKFSIFVVG